MNLILAFLTLDTHIALRYRFRFITDLIQTFFVLLIFFYLSRSLGELDMFKGEYFPYILLGVSFSKFYTTSGTSATSRLIDLQYMGLLDTIFVAPHSRAKTLLSMGSSEVMRGFFFFLLNIFAAVWVFDVSLSLSGHIHWPILVLTFFITFCLCQVIGLIGVCSILLWKRINLVNMFSSMAMMLLGGVYFPIKVLPAWLQMVAKLVPFTQAMALLRYSFGSSVEKIDPSWSLFYLTGVTVVLSVFSWMLYRYSHKKVLEKGSLSLV